MTLHFKGKAGTAWGGDLLNLYAISDDGDLYEYSFTKGDFGFYELQVARYFDTPKNGMIPISANEFHNLMDEQCSKVKTQHLRR